MIKDYEVKKIFTTYGLNEILDKEGKVIIYGAGDYGKRIVDYIISIGKQDKIEAFWVTEKREERYRGIEIIESGDGYSVGSDILIIIAVPQAYLSEIVGKVQQHGKRYCCVTQFLYDEIGREPTSRQIGTYEGLDFLVAGFLKCGTTSLHRILMDVEDVYVSKSKESLFFSWCDKVENPKEQLVRNYFNDIREGQIVGAVEPSFARSVKDVRDFFGKRVKILFLVRNPVNASFSQFRMASRNRGAVRLIEPYKKFGGEYKEGVFEEYCKRWSGVKIFKYADYIQQFLECWPKDQIKIIIFEEMIQNTRKIINEILQFIGSSNKYMCEGLPQVNKGEYILADVEGLEIARRRGNLIFENKYLQEASGRNRDEIKNELAELEKQYNRARKIYDVKLSQNERKVMEAYYYDSVRELEGMLNRDLSEVWF